MNIYKFQIADVVYVLDEQGERWITREEAEKEELNRIKTHVVTEVDIVNKIITIEKIRD